MRVKILTFAFSCCYVPETAVKKTTRGTEWEGSQDQPFSAGDVRQDTKREDGLGRLRQYHGQGVVQMVNRSATEPAKASSVQGNVPDVTGPMGLSTS